MRQARLTSFRLNLPHRLCVLRQLFQHVRYTLTFAPLPGRKLDQNRDPLPSPLGGELLTYPT
jgi:hypothetical protein